MNKKSNKKKEAPWWLLVLLIPLIRAVNENGMPPAVLLVAAAVIVLFIAMGKLLAKKSERAKNALEKRGQAAAPTAPSVEPHRPAPSMQRPAAGRSFPKPEAPCVVCEQTGEDHFARDRKRRIAQLDDWLKNGLIDRQEYQVLKRRFENDE